MSDWLKLVLPGKEPKTGIPASGQSVVLYLCPRDYWKGWDKVWRRDIGSLRMEADTIPVWNSTIGHYSPFDGMKLEDILKDYEICFAEIPPLDAKKFASEGWAQAEMTEGKEPEVPLTGQAVVLCCRSRDRHRELEIDIGSTWIESGETDTLVWGSAFGLQSGFDGVKFEDILRDYEVCFTEVPPLEAGRFPSPLGISLEQRETNYRAHINRVLDDLK